MKFNTKLIIKSTLVALLLLAIQGVSVGQESESEASPLSISGSVDTYYKYDFSSVANRPTWFGSDQKSVSIGMVDLLFEKTSGKTAFVAEVAFGPRGDGSGGSQDGGTATAPGSIQNLYVSYAVSDALSLTAGFMGTFVGYEVISPASNFNYSASYLFSNGPFQNAGFKLDYAVADNFGIMVGLFSSTWDSYYSDASEGMDNFGAQLSFSPTEGWDIYANYLAGTDWQQWDLTTGYQISDPLYLGLNVSQNGKYGGDDEAGFFGIAGYFQYAISEVTALGLRYENFAPENEANFGSGTISSFTFSANITAGDLTFIPEFRFDSSNQMQFVDGDGAAADKFSEILLAAVYTF